MTKHLLTSFFVYFLISCGGDGNDIKKQNQQVLVFEQAVINVQLNTATVINNISGGSGSGEINYSINNDTVAQIDNLSGIVTLISGGKATITATKLADDSYNEISTSYQLEVIEPVNKLVVELGLNNARIIYQDNSQPINIYRSTDALCDINNYASCDNSQLIQTAELATNAFLDDYINVDRSAFITVENGGTVSSTVEVNSLPFLRRGGHQLIAFNDKLFIIAGSNWSGSQTVYYNDIWSSQDGITWQEEANEAAFSKRSHHKILKFNDELWLFGGVKENESGGSMGLDDVWRSPDGIHWTQVPQVSSYGYTRNPEVVFFNQRLWLFKNLPYQTSEIWSSPDGSNWIREVVSPDYGDRRAYPVVNFNQKLWIIAGNDSANNHSVNNIWSSLDGINWTEESADGGFQSRGHHRVVELNGKLYMLGGLQDSQLASFNDAWSSTDGIVWQNISNAPLKYSDTREMTVHNGKIWAYGGLGDTHVWFSEDGIIWRTATSIDIDWP